MFIGFQQLEVGFDTRDNFDDSVPVVQDFFIIADEFQSSPSPLYVVLEGDIISKEGKDIYDEVILELSKNDKITGLTIGIWSILEESRASNLNLDLLLTNLSENNLSWKELESWLLSEEGRNISSSNIFSLYSIFSCKYILIVSTFLVKISPNSLYSVICLLYS